jgi:flavin-binding protein dodecin
MPERTYKLIELVGVSEKSIQEAVRNAVARASRTVKNVDWFEVTEVRGLVKSGKVSEFQVKVKIGFRVLDAKQLRDN